MEGDGRDGGTDGGEESGGAGLPFHPWAVIWWWLLARAVRWQDWLASMVVVVGMEQLSFVC